MMTLLEARSEALDTFTAQPWTNELDFVVRHPDHGLPWLYRLHAERRGDDHIAVIPQALGRTDHPDSPLPNWILR